MILKMPSGRRRDGALHSDRLEADAEGGAQQRDSEQERIACGWADTDD
jgi:hypothetical protein